MTAVVALPVKRRRPSADGDRCLCLTCQALDRRFPAEGWQLRLPLAATNLVHLALGESR